jgi:hypothetical protein
MSPTHLVWLDHQPSNANLVTSAPKAGADAGVRGGYEAAFIAIDPVSPGTYYVATGQPGQSHWQIMKASVSDLNALAGFRGELRPIGGIAVDATHVYWTQQDDGRVYRARKD